MEAEEDFFNTPSLPAFPKITRWEKSLDPVHVHVKCDYRTISPSGSLRAGRRVGRGMKLGMKKRQVAIENLHHCCWCRYCCLVVLLRQHASQRGHYKPWPVCAVELNKGDCQGLKERENVCLGPLCEMWNAHPFGHIPKCQVPWAELGQAAVLYWEWLEVAQDGKHDVGSKEEGRHLRWALRSDKWDENDKPWMQALRGARKVGGRGGTGQREQWLKPQALRPTNVSSIPAQSQPWGRP